MKTAIAFLFVSMIIAGCTQKKDVSFSAPRKISKALQAGCTYFTQDHKRNPVLCWTESEGNRAQLFMATFNTEKREFNDASAVPPSIGTGLHSESMNKVAYKPDGTIVAVYEKKHPTETNKYAGSIFYTQSFDNGATWSQEKYLHTDTLPVYSRSFFDIGVLPDGEIGAVWLDGRLKLGEEGSSLFFAKTKGKDGFQPDYQVGETVCECCRTDMYVDDHKNIHIVFRDIESTIEGQVRDFVHIVSHDNGNTFSKGEKISNDKWIIDGCPHTGASMVSVGGVLSVSWFTGGGEPGLYLTQTNDTQEFQSRQLLSKEARHPQISANGNELVAVWDNVPSGESHHHHGAGHASHGTHEELHGHISFALLNYAGNKIYTVPHTDAAEFPAVFPLSNRKVIIAYTRDNAVEWQEVSF